jgi:hypothetical protein
MVRIVVNLPTEIAFALKKYANTKKIFDAKIHFGVRHRQSQHMPNQRSADKVCVSAYVPRTTQRRLKKLADKRGQSLTELVESLYIEATREIELTPEDYRQIANEVEQAARGTDQRVGRSRNKKKAAAKG